MERALARDCGKVQRFLLYILVTNVHGQVLRAHFLFKCHTYILCI